MAYRKEGDEIVIDGWEKGIAPSPFEGISDMRVANINNVPGTVGVGFTITANALSGGGSSLGRPYYKAVDLTSPTYYVLDTNGRVWSSSSLGGTFTYLSSGDSLTGAGQNQMGLVFWNGYLIRFRNDSIDWYSGGTWHIGWNPATGGTGATGVITGSTTHFAIAAQDDAIYFCNGQYVGSILARLTPPLPRHTRSTHRHCSCRRMTVLSRWQSLVRRCWSAAFTMLFTRGTGFH
jgi:hypothetical protein